MFTLEDERTAQLQKKLEQHLEECRIEDTELQAKLERAIDVAIKAFASKSGYNPSMRLLDYSSENRVAICNMATAVFAEMK
jgi:hypothetical protein